MTHADSSHRSLARRLGALRFSTVRRALRRIWGPLAWASCLLYFGFVLAVLGLRYLVLPHIEDYRADIERLASQELGQSVSIGKIEASWDGVNPDLTLLDVRIANAQGQPAVSFSRVEAILSWWSVPSAQLTLSLLRIDEPTLHVRRDQSGVFSVAGIPVDLQASNTDVSDWILAQKRIRIRGATVVWEDELRGAPALILEDLDFALDNSGKRHCFGLTALPPQGLASRIDIRGDLVGRDLEQIKSWSGKAYAELDYTDLAIWRQWVDYPVALPQGRGGVRLWLGFNDGKVRDLTTDIVLQDVNLRLAPDLPMLELEHMSGRLEASFPDAGFVLAGRQVVLETEAVSPAEVEAPDEASEAEKPEAIPPIRVEATDFYVEWKPALDGKGGRGSASASLIDLAALAGLAGYMPFDARSRQLLDEFAPRGRVSGLSAKWKGDAERLQTYSLKASFDALALKAHENFPGFTGLSGTFEASETAGAVSLKSQKTTVDLPTVFPESVTRLDSLSAQAKWTLNKGVLEAKLARAEFSGPQVVGSAQGTYRHTGEGPGSVDLTAALTHADARAVWRYMPHAVGEGARFWLRDSLISGHAVEAKLILKGDLSDFPFLDKSKGQFLVTVKAKDVVLDYSIGWPRIERIDGDLRFEGNGMTLLAHKGGILGAQLSDTHVEIPDFDKPVSTLYVKGKASGPTSEFFKFIEQSPVGARIDHFTADMRALGEGKLDLDLVIPLDEEKLGDSKVNGTFKMVGNEIKVDPGLPGFKQVNGSVQFSESDLRVPEISATLFGGPLKIKGGSQKDGKVLITANGSITVEQLRKQFASPILANLSGATSYRGEVRINKRDADLVVDSTLLGMASSFPDPFAKKAAEALPLRFEKQLLPGSVVAAGSARDLPVRDQISVSLGKVLAAQFVRRKQADGFLVERGAITVGRPLQLPDSGILLGLTTKQLDVEKWRRLLASPAGGGTAEAPFALNAISIKADDLVLMGRHYTDVDLMAISSPSQWKARLSSKQAVGDLMWDKEGKGKLTARFKQVAIEPATDRSEAIAGEALKELPALDVVADEFSLGSKRFGRLELLARNEGGVWQLSKMQASNPYGKLSASGQWRTTGGKQSTQLDFNVDSSDVGKLLDRMGYVGTIRGGVAQFGGKVGWNGSPTDFDYASLSGSMKLEAGSGQFLKLDPGAAGKLLGLISLQGLPRRISLDFKDVFSDGFAFDSVSSKLTVVSGVMHTDRLQIDGPSARVLIRGDVDLKNETQQLDVNVQPELGGTAALGIALINPIAGAATWLAHKALQNPLNHMFGFDYRVTGKWDDPKVEKISGNQTPAANSTPRLPSISNQPETKDESNSK